MDVETERLDAEQLRRMSTAELVRHALDETRHLVRAEVQVAREELREEVAEARVAGVLLGAGGALAVAGLTLLLVAVALSLPLRPSGGALLVGLIVLLVGAVVGIAGLRRIPRRPMPRTQERLRKELRFARETRH